MLTVFVSSPGNANARTRVRQTTVKEKDFTRILGRASGEMLVAWFERFGVMAMLKGMDCVDATWMIRGWDTATSRVRRGVEERENMEEPDGEGERESREKSLEGRWDVMTGSAERVEVLSRPLMSGFDRLVVPVSMVLRSASFRSLVRLVLLSNPLPVSRELSFELLMTGWKDCVVMLRSTSAAASF